MNGGDGNDTLTFAGKNAIATTSAGKATILAGGAGTDVLQVAGLMAEVGDSERMLLYRELDRLESDEEVEAYRKRMIDRFGPVPHEADELMHVVGLRRVGKKLGCEKIILKQGYMQMQFVSNVNSPFYRSQMFNRILAYVTSHIQDCVLKEKFNKRMLRINDVKTVGQAVNLLNQISQIDLGNKTDD